MDFNTYQDHARSTNKPHDDEFQKLIAIVLGLCDEAGEVQSIFKKWIRDDGADPEKLSKEDVAKELGDVLWYIAITAHELGIDLEDIARLNVEKLKSRSERGVLGGSGDNR